MRVLFIYTENDPWALGMRSVVAVVKRAGHHTRILLMGSDKESYPPIVLEEMKKLAQEAEVICVSCFSRGSDKAKQVVEHLRSLGKITVWGGVHATLNPQDCANYVDLVCVGEGEEFILDLIGRLETGNDLLTIENGAFCHEGKVVINPLRPLMGDLDQLPLVDFSFEDECHLKGDDFIRVSDFSDVTEPIMFSGSRGCSYNCTYCSNAKLKQLFAGKGRYVRRMSVPKYIEHLKTLRNSFPKSKYYYLIDEDFFAQPLEELRAFAEVYRQEIGLPFEVLGSPVRITEEKVGVLVKAGLWRVRMGIESGSERVKREVYKRYMTNEVVMRATRAINKYPQVVPYYFIIISNPYEETEDLLETVQFIASLPNPFYLQCFNLIFFPGTALYDRAVHDGLILGTEDSGYQLDYRGGLHYEGHDWKRKNLYLNGLLFLMEGKSTPSRLGLLPRLLVRVFLYQRVIRFNERFPSLIKMAIAAKSLTLLLRKHGARWLTRIIGDPRTIYNLKAYLRRKEKPTPMTVPSAMSSQVRITIRE